MRLLRYRMRGKLEGELRHLHRLSDRWDVAVDIGANAGLYTYRMSRLFREVVAFEPNEAVLGDLRAARLPNLTIHPVALSSTFADSRRLFIPGAGGVVHDGWASFDPDNLATATTMNSMDVPVRTLDSFALEGVSFIKIDVEGHELEVLHGAVETLSRCKPTVLSEAKAKNRGALLDFFHARDYRAHQLQGRRLTVLTAAEAEAAESDNFIFRHAGGARR